MTDRKGKFIAVANMKGGVGKTTTVVSLAEFLALDGKASVLVIDLDQQASASLCIIGDKALADLIVNGRTIEAFFALKLIRKMNADIWKRIRTNNCTVTKEGVPVFLSLLPAGPDLRLVEREMLYSLTREKLDMEAIEKKLLEFFLSEFAPLKSKFDYVIFDCAPGISPFTEIAIRSSDLIIVPTIPDRMSAFGLKGFCEIIAKYESTAGKRKLPHLLFTRVQTNVRQHREVQIDLRQRKAFQVFDTIIPQSAALADAVFVDDPLPGAAPFIPTLKGKYGALMVEILTNLANEVRSIVR